MAENRKFTSIFTIFWKIENFSYTLGCTTHIFESRTINAGNLENTDWILAVHGDGSCSLTRCEDASRLDKIEVALTLKVFTAYDVITEEELLNPNDRKNFSFERNASFVEQFSIEELSEKLKHNWYEAIYVVCYIVNMNAEKNTCDTFTSFIKCNVNKFSREWIIDYEDISPLFLNNEIVSPSFKSQIDSLPRFEIASFDFLENLHATINVVNKQNSHLGIQIQFNGTINSNIIFSLTLCDSSKTLKHKLVDTLIMGKSFNCTNENFITLEEFHSSYKKMLFIFDCYFKNDSITYGDPLISLNGCASQDLPYLLRCMSKKLTNIDTSNNAYLSFRLQSANDFFHMNANYWFELYVFLYSGIINLSNKGKNENWLTVATKCNILSLRNEILKPISNSSI